MKIPKIYDFGGLIHLHPDGDIYILNHKTQEMECLGYLTCEEYGGANPVPSPLIAKLVKVLDKYEQDSSH